MGPTIVLDKSAIQSLSARAVRELSRYFYTNITPVLLYEILADVKLDRLDLADAKAKVAVIAGKVLPFDAITSAPYHWLCLSDLLGRRVPMERRPVVAGSQRVTTADGRVGLYRGIQAEDEAVLRWRAGDFSQADLDFAVEWREAIRGMNLEATKASLPKLTYRLKSLAELREFVDAMLADESAQPTQLNWLMDLLVLQGEYRELVLRRWSDGRFASLATFSPYGHYCLWVHTLFLMGMSHGLVGTRNSNVIDIQYLFYMPFARIFCSGDKFLRQMASVALGADQSFVWHDDLRQALDELASRREAARTTGGDTAAEEIEPAERSLVWNLWVMHRGRFVPQAKRQRISPERSAEIMNEIRPISEAMDKAARERRPPDRWPL